jgi:hypothetical protein
MDSDTVFKNTVRDRRIVTSVKAKQQLAAEAEAGGRFQVFKR